MERYYAYLRNIFLRARFEFDTIMAETILKLAIKACNDTAGPHDLAPALLVFCVVPRMPIHPDDLPAKMESMNAMYIVRQRMTKTVAKNRLKTAVNRQAPGKADIEL